MIVFDLRCARGHGFEGWFTSSADYDRQSRDAMLACPVCGTTDIAKAPMAPAVGTKGNRSAASAKSSGGTKLPTPGLEKMLRKLAEAQTKALENSQFVGKDFAAETRAIHYGETQQRTIHGEASPAEARILIEEGIAVSPLPFPVAAPDELN